VKILHDLFISYKPKYDSIPLQNILRASSKKASHNSKLRHKSSQGMQQTANWPAKRKHTFSMQ
jgi:hypothetical protein